MALYSYKGIKPEIAAGVYIAPSADIIGKVVLDENVSLWHQTVLRGDVNWIKIGKNTNVQDLSMLHVTSVSPLIIGSEVSIGHSVTLHGCTIEDHCLIGMGAVILDNAIVKKNCVVAAGSVVPPGKIFPEGSMIMGNPATVKRPLTEDEIKLFGNHFRSYLIYKDEFLNGDIVSLIDGPKN